MTRWPVWVQVLAIGMALWLIGGYLAYTDQGSWALPGIAGVVLTVLALIARALERANGRDDER